MPVNTPHPEYERMLPVWQDIRIAIAGARAVKEAGERYLPRLHEQTPEEYNSYKTRAVFYGATARTADGFVGIITRKPAAITAPAALDAFKDDCDRQGTSFEQYKQVVLRDQNEVARCGTLIDWTEKSEPYVTHYTAEQIINWKYSRIGSETLLSFVMLHEQSSTYNAVTGDDVPDQYEQPTYDQWREFRLIGTTADALSVEMILWRMKRPKPAQTTNGRQVKQNGGTENKSVEFVEIERKMLSRRGITTLPGIPFVIHTGANASPAVCAKPCLEDITELNFAHYRASADIWNGRHMAGLPTPWATGFTDEKTTHLTLGTSRAWTTTNTEAKCGILEMEGTALKTIKEGMEELERQMAALGARAIEPQKKEAEAVGTVVLRARAETASLITIAEVTSTSLSFVLQWAAWITSAIDRPADAAKDAFLVIPSDMTGGKMAGADLTAFVSAYQLGGISFETFFHNLQAGELYPDARTIEQEQTAIEQGGPKPPLPDIPEGDNPTAGA